MNAKQKANKIANRFVTKSVFDMDDDQLKTEREAAKKHAIICVKEIVEALKVTTGHCELRELDLQEVKNDFSFWYSVIDEIEAL